MSSSSNNPTSAANPRRPTPSDAERQERKRQRDDKAKQSNHGLGAAPATFGVEFEGTAYRALRENSATQLFVDQNAVFYNPVQETNRDLSVAAIKCYVALRRAELAEDRAAAAAKGKALSSLAADLPPLRLLEALSASGLRSIRYAKEIPGLGEIVANDLDAAAVAAIERNVRFNAVPANAAAAAGGAFIRASHADAIDLMYACRAPADQFDVVDLDPYGSASPFVDNAMRAVKDGGMMLVTCTDMAVLGGNQQDVCYGKYGAAPVKGTHVHEQALRIVLQMLSRVAAQQRRTIEPLLSLSIDFYVRVMVRVRDAPNESRRVFALHSLLFQCVGCDAFALQPLGTESARGKDFSVKPARGPPVAPTCEHCGSRHSLGGPIWNSVLHNQAFATAVADELTANAAKYGSQKKALSFAATAMNELPDPLGYALPSLCQTLKISMIKDVAFHSALLALGHQVSHSHTSATFFKTTAPMSVLWDVMRCMAQLEPRKAPQPDTPAAVLLAKPPAIKADFTVRREAIDLRHRRPTLVVNPSFWGPKRRATGERPDKKARVGAAAAAAEAATTDDNE